MKNSIATMAIAVPLLALTACGGEDGDEEQRTARNRAGAISTLVEFAHAVDDEDYAAGCALIEEQMRADGCEDNLKELRGEADPGEFGEMSEADPEVSAFATSGCAYYIAQEGRDGAFLPTGSAVVVWHDRQWWVSSVSNLDSSDFAGEKRLS